MTQLACLAFERQCAEFASQFSSGPDLATADAGQTSPLFSLTKKNIYLVGMRGSGKTTVGRALAQALGCALMDTDALIVQSAQEDIASIVARQGWDHFRALEKKALEQAAALPGKVVATGGGIILAPENRALINQTGICFYLAAPASLLAERLTRTPDDGQRPPLTSLALRDEVAAVLTEREPLYMTVQDHLLHAGRTVDELVHDIVRALGS